MTLPTPYQKEADEYVEKQKSLEFALEELSEAKRLHEIQPHECDCEFCDHDTERAISFCQKEVDKARAESESAGLKLEKAIRKAKEAA